MYNLIIVGAGGFGREVLDYVQNDPESVSLPTWEIAGFLDANTNALDGYKIDLPILGNPATYVPSANERFILAIADPATKLRIAQQLIERKAIFVSIIHSSSVIGSACNLGMGCVICPRVVITTNVRIGDFVHINAASTIGHDARVGTGCTLSGHVDVTGNAQLGEGVFLGSHATVLPNVCVGDYARIGAGSVVISNLPPEVTAFGVPAKKLIVPGKPRG